MRLGPGPTRFGPGLTRLWPATLAARTRWGCVVKGSADLESGSFEPS
jgi:hypothetical protein